MHVRPYVAWVDPINAQVGMRRRELSREHRRDLFEGRFARAVSAPAQVRIDGRVTGYVYQPCARLELVAQCLDERDGRYDVREQDFDERFEIEVEHAGERRRTKRARIVDQRVETGV